jgi:hypothetical protein
MARVRWFIAGAATAAGALVAAPKAYERLRSLTGADDAPQLVDAPPPPPPAEPPKARPAAAIATFDVERTSELRQKIDETRARIHEKTAVRPDQTEAEDDLTEEVEPD